MIWSPPSAGTEDASAIGLGGGRGFSSGIVPGFCSICAIGAGCVSTTGDEVLTLSWLGRDFGIERLVSVRGGNAGGDSVALRLRFLGLALLLVVPLPPPRTLLTPPMRAFPPPATSFGAFARASTTPFPILSNAAGAGQPNPPLWPGDLLNARSFSKNRFMPSLSASD